MLALVFLLNGCGAPTSDISSENGKQQLLDRADAALTYEDCSTAIDILQPLYDSQYSDNTVRLKMASAYGCYAKINFFKLIGDLATNANTLTTGGLWGYLAKTFPSTSGQDHVVEGALLGMDALEATIKPGVPILPANQVNPGTNNVGSVFAADREDDANIYLFFISMAGIGGIESRYGNPDSSYKPQSSMPWITATQVTGDGCGYAASILNFFDMIPVVGTDVSSSLAGTLQTVQGDIQTYLDEACDEGCKGLKPQADGSLSVADKAVLDPGNKWAATGCNFPSGCGGCPAVLRNRNSCTGQTTDEASCAAAGLANFINYSVPGWQ